MPRGLRPRSLALLFLALFVLRCSTGAGRSMGPGNNPPVANADQATTQQGTPATVTVTANDTDPDGNRVSLTGATLETTATGVSVTTNLQNGEVTVDPGSNFTGTIEVSYQIIDDGTPPRTASGTLTVGVVAGNPPVTVDDQATTQQGVPVTVDVLANDSDPDGGSLTTADPVFLGAQPAGSSVQVNGDGTLTIDPGPSFTGTFQVGYIARDPTGLEGAGIVTVTVTAPAPATSVRVDIVNDSGDPYAGLAAAFRISEGAWMPATETAPGTFEFMVPSGEWRYGFTARLGDVAQTVEATTAETTALRLKFRDPSVPLVNFAYEWTGLDNLGDGALGVQLHGIAGFAGASGGASGAGTVASYRAERQNFGLVGTDDGVPVGVAFVRDVTPTDGGTISFEFMPEDMGGSMSIAPFTIGPGFSGSFLVNYSTGLSNTAVGFGTESGGVFYTIPESRFDEDDDYYVVKAIATTTGGDVSHCIVEHSPGPLVASGFALPDPLTGVSAPAPAAYPTFTGLTSDDPDHRMFELGLIRQAPTPAINWQFKITKGWLDLGNDPAAPAGVRSAVTTMYTVGDPTALPGFEDFAFVSGDLVLFIITQVSSNKDPGETLTANTSFGLPLIDGLSQKAASVNGSYAVP